MVRNNQIKIQHGRIKKITNLKDIVKCAKRQGGIPVVIKGTDKIVKGEGLLHIHFLVKSDYDINFEEISRQ